MHGTPTSSYKAAKEGNIVQVLLDRDVNISIQTNFGWIALHMAARHGHMDVVHSMLAAGADVYKKSCHGLTVLHCTAEKEEGLLVLPSFLLLREVNIYEKDHR